uniref:Uncharacterized protein n=1 Tax=Mustela putorius furo TaxID=9669 RepID=M3Y758_MUSPF
MPLEEVRPQEQRCLRKAALPGGRDSPAWRLCSPLNELFCGDDRHRKAGLSLKPEQLESGVPGSVAATGIARREHRVRSRRQGGAGGSGVPPGGAGRPGQCLL